jgi:uracil-DNA glycosylase
VTPSAFVAALAKVHLPDVFNPYSDRCPFHDRPDASQLRRRNLEVFIQAALDRKADTMWIARDLGYRGGRRTGIPLTDDVRLPLISALMGTAALQKPTRGADISERTAAVVWQVLVEIKRPVVLWNIFPFHPHHHDDPFSNRCHTTSERRRALPFLFDLIAMVNPRRLVAIGRDAEHELRAFALPVTGVRHPSYGGQTEFIKGLRAAYGLRTA